MQLPKFVELVKSLENADPAKLPQLVSEIKGVIDSCANEPQQLNPVLSRTIEIIMRTKDVKDECLPYYEDLVCEVFKISAKHQFKVGYDALSYCFNYQAQFYKTAGIDTMLAFPIGRDRPLKQYIPAVGELCDVVRPYITSTSICGWTRCVVQEIENNRFTFKYVNCKAEVSQRERPWFAPLGTRMKDYDWRMSLEVGSPIDALHERVWYSSTIAQVSQDDSCKNVRVTFRRFSPTGDRVDSHGNRYYGLMAGQDEWLDVLSPRIQMSGKMATKKLCYYSVKCDEMLLDDQYDLLFQEQYNQKPFYAIARPYLSKSTSLLKFMNMFVSLGGFEKTLQHLQENANEALVYPLLAFVGFSIKNLPRMFLKDTVLPEIYENLIPYILKGVKNITVARIELLYFCMDNIGRRIYSLTELLRDLNKLRRCLIRQFLKLNMEKQMLALRYLNQLVHPKKPNTFEEEEELNSFLKQEKIFDQIFNGNMHDQFLSRTGFLIQYMIKQEIISLKQFQTMWNVVPASDKRGRATIQKLLSDISKKLPQNFVEFLISKLLLLKQTELTTDNLNLLKQLKNTSIQNGLQMKILTFLWDIITVKSANIKANIEEEVEKVFKGYVETIKDQKIRMVVLQSMVQKLQDCKKIKNQIELLKDFIKTYADKKQSTHQMVEEGLENTPSTRLEAVHFIKTKGIYAGLLNQLFKQKDASVKKDILEFISFLFENDTDDINPIIRHIYEKIGPASFFLQWLNKISNRSSQFIIQFFEKTNDFIAFEDINSAGFDALQGLIINVNELKQNLKILTTYHYKKQNKTSVGTGPVTGDATNCCEQKKDDKFIGPLLPQTKKHIYVLISPFKLIGMKFLERMLHVVKQNSVYNSIIKLIIQLVTNLDETIEQKTEQFRKQFLFDILKEIKNTVDEGKYDAQVKTKLQVYLNLFLEIFCQTQKDGLGDCVPHFERIQGEKITLNIENLFDQEKTKNKKQPLPRLTVTRNQNCTIWSFKKAISQLIQEAPEDIDIIKYTDPMSDTNNGKSLTELLFYDNESIKIAKKATKPLPRSDLFNKDKSDLSEKFEAIIKNFFNQYRNAQIEGLYPQDLQRLSKQKWRGSLFKQKGKLEKIFQLYDDNHKGYLTYADFKRFFMEKAKGNESAVWILINLSGYKNNFKPSAGKEEAPTVKTSNLPRKILSCPEVYKLIFEIFEKQSFKQLHLNFYRLLCMLEVNSIETEQIQHKIYSIIQKQQSAHALCYSLEVINAQLAKRSNFYFDFWKNNGIKKIQNRIEQILSNGKSLYELEALMKNHIFPGFVRVLNMYVYQILSKYKIAKFLNENRMNYIELQDLVKKLSVIKEPKEDETKLTLAGKSLWEFGQVDEVLKSIYVTCNFLFNNLIQNYSSEKNDYLSKLLVEIARVLGFLIGSHPKYHSFNPREYLSGIKSGGMSYRRTAVNLIYIYLFHSDNDTSREIQQILNKLLEEIPTESKIENSNYFSLLKEIITKYLQMNENSNEKDEFFISLGNLLLNDLFEKVEGESRTALISEKTLMGILSVIDAIVSKKEVCLGLSWRMIEMTEKCLFAYNIEQKLKQLTLTEEMLANPKQQQHFKNYVMCKTEDSRNIVYSIVAKMHQVSPGIQPLYINNYLLPVIKSVNPDVRLCGSKSMDVGLKNFGSTCYMNSMLQVLNSVGPFRNSIMKCQSEAPLVIQLKKLFAALFFSERMDYAPKDMLTKFNPPINPAIQQDTTQFLNFLFDQVQLGLQGTKYRKLLDEIFKGANSAQMICHSCGYKKENKEQFFSFGVEIQGKFDLQSALEGSYQGQIISDYLCDQCQNRGETTKRNILSQIPSVMFIHLKRIVFNYDMFVNMKIHTRLEFPQELNIQPYTKEGVELRESLGLEYMKNLAHNQEEAKKFQALAEHGKPKDFYKLKLKGVIVHSGSADVGHYYSILPKEKQWRKYDDSRVSFFGTNSFDSECYGGIFTSQEWGSSSSVNAYVLVYEKVVKNPLQIFGDGSEMTDETTKLQYDEIKVYNSVEDYWQLWMDNHSFMVETHLLDSKTGKGFIDFMCKIINDSPSEVDKIGLVAEIIYNISFHSGVVGDLVKIVKENVHLVSPNIFYSHIVNDKAKTFKLLFSNDKPVRQFMASFMHAVIMEAYKNGDQNSKADALAYITELLNSMAVDVAKNWLRVDGYFALLYLLVSSSPDFPELWKFFRDRNLISTLIDYVMEKKSPVRINSKGYSLGTKTTPMDFSSGISIISFYVKHSYGFTGKNYETPAIPEHLLFHLNNNDVICLSFKPFYMKMISQRQNLRELSLLIQRLCIMHLEFSREICDVVLQNISSITDSKDEMQDLSGICLQILKIRDDYWVNRAEMLLGIGAPFVTGNNLMETLDEEKFMFTPQIYDIFPVECLLSYVYVYRLKNTLACFNLIKAIVQGCCVSDVSMRYLTRQPSSSYLYQNYLSWMEAFIKTFVSYATTDQKVKERLLGQVEHIMKYVEDLKIYMKEHPEVDFYKPLITGQIKQKSLLNTIVKDGVQLNLYEYEVYCINSEPLPNGGNKALSHVLQSMRLTKPVSDNSNILRLFKKPAKPIPLGSEPVVDDQDKELIGLFDPETEKKNVTNQGIQAGSTIQQEVKKEQKEQKKQRTEVTEEIMPSRIEQQINVQGIFVVNYFRELEMVNKTKDKKVIRVVFDGGESPNTIIPHEHSWKLFTKTNESLWMAKQDPMKDWGNLEIKTYIEQFLVQKHDRKTISSWWFKCYGQKDSNMKEQLGVQNKDEGLGSSQAPQKPLDPPPVNPPAAEIPVLNCPTCTFFNPISNVQCDACGNPLR